MKSFLLFTAGGPMVIITLYSRINAAPLLEKLADKGIEKFIAHELPIEIVASRYGFHFDSVKADFHESDALRVLDYSGSRIFRLFTFDELGAPEPYEQLPVSV